MNVPALYRSRLVTGAALIMGILAFCMIVQYVMWWVAALLIVVWGYCYVLPRFSRLTAFDVRLAVWFMLLILQSIHFSEHVAQMVQIHVYDWLPMNSHGIFGAAFDVEWMHFMFDTLWIPVNTVFLLATYGRQANGWLWVLLPFALWHGFEHVVIIGDYLKTGMIGTPGLLATGGHLWPNSPFIRPDLHFLYNLIEEIFILVGYRRQVGWSLPSVCGARAA